LSDAKGVYESGDYTLQADKVLLDNSAWDTALRRQYDKQEQTKLDSQLAVKRQRLEKIRLAIRSADEERMAREKEAERVAGHDQGPGTVPAELVKEEADAMLAEAQQ
jgi:cytochrome c biogenesis protein ResB